MVKITDSNDTKLYIHIKFIIQQETKNISLIIKDPLEPEDGILDVLLLHNNTS